MKEKDKIELIIESYDVNGYGVAHVNGLIVFVKGALVGEKVLAVVENVHKKYVFAKAIKISNPSKDRIEPECPFYTRCGGCDNMHMNYECEKKIKENKVKNTLYKFKDYKFNNLISNDVTTSYRNKVLMPYARDKEDNLLYGFYRKGTHNIVPINKCLVSPNIVNDIISFIGKYLSIFHVSIYNEDTNKGIFREVMVRNSSLGEIMVVLIVTKKYDFSNLINYLKDEFPAIKSIYLNINDKNTNVILTDEYELLYGKEYIIEDVLGLKFEVNFRSFLQVNHDMMEILYKKAFDLADLKKSDNVIDAYCGIGTITLNLAKRCNKVYGIEIVEQAIENANYNKKLNNIDNVEFILGKCEEEIQKLVNKEKIDVIFFDPPRKGCAKEFLDTVIKMKIPKIIYISCNIATCQRDIEILTNNGYKLEEVTPVDMFARTEHVESIVTLSLNKFNK